MRGLKRAALAGGLAVALVTAMAGSALADYGPGAVYQVELTANASGPEGGGVWLWLALYPDNTGDYSGSDCGHGFGSVRDQGDVTWAFTDQSHTWIAISGVTLNGLGGFPTTLTVPAAYGHYSGTIGTFLTLPGFIPPFIGTSQLQVAP
jgi:hypothetical protein